MSGVNVFISKLPHLVLFFEGGGRVGGAPYNGLDIKKTIYTIVIITMIRKIEEKLRIPRNPSNTLTRY